jgi:hypothetical protein
MSAYRVEPRGMPCGSCGHSSEGFDIIRPDSVVMDTYDDQETAEELATDLSQAYVDGLRAAVPLVIQTAVGQDGSRETLREQIAYVIEAHAKSLEAES